MPGSSSTAALGALVLLLCAGRTGGGLVPPGGHREWGRCARGPAGAARRSCSSQPGRRVSEGLREANRP